jgi:hypothetical protein
MVGGYGRGHRHRNWYFATGIPGYGRGRRCFWPYPPEDIYPGPVPGPWAAGVWMPPELSPQEELRMLQEEEQMLSEDLEDARKRIEELRKELEKEVK